VLYFKVVVYSSGKWRGPNDVLTDSKQCKEMRMQIFHFDERYIMRRKKRLSFPDAQWCTMSQNFIKLINIKIFKKRAKEIVPNLKYRLLK
jgi:hypothetical protein